jgi:hypothetical protein
MSRSRLFKTAALLLPLAFAAAPGRAQFCGTNENNPAPMLPAFDWQSNFVALTRLGNHYMPTFGDGDSMTEPFWLQGGQGTPFGSDGLHETWYISRDQLSGTAPFYRLIGGTDHMDSHDPNEASGLGYHQEFLHGYPWTTQKAGTSPLTRYIKGSIFDHRTWLADQIPAGYNTDLVWNAASGIPRFGYQRFGNLLDYCYVYPIAYVDNLSNAKLRIDFNKVWGNAIGKITWLPTNQQLVREQIGAMVQSTLFTATGTDAPGTCCIYNPTQSGGADIYNFGNTKRWAGSPILSSSYSGTNPRSQITELKPFNFTFNAWQGNDPWSPLMWRGTFLKTTTLGYNLDGTVYDDVIKIRFQAKEDADAPAAMLDLHNMNNTFWLSLNPFGDGNTNSLTIELLTAQTGAVSNLGYPPGGFNTDILVSNPVGKAVVVSNLAATFSVGIYSPTDVDFYKILYFCDGAAPSGGTCPSAFQTIVLDTFNDKTLTTTYVHNEDVYMVVGTRAAVIQRIRRVHCHLNGGINCNSVG